MLQGQWPKRSCDYCRIIEEAGGASDRITSAEFWPIDPPQELEQDPQAIKVTPRILEIYFNNTCNLKCVYCGPAFSSLWNDELARFKDPEYFTIDSNFEQNKQRCFEWLTANVHELYQLNFLGGEPLYQAEFDQLLDIIEQNPAPDLALTFFSNLAVAKDKLITKIDRIEQLINQKKLKSLTITASLDCWGPEQEYARYPIKLTVWEKNFEYILSKPWITVTIGSTITPLTIKSLDQLMLKINQWNLVRPVYWYGNSVNGPDYMFIDQFGPEFLDDFNRAIDLMPDDLPERRSVKDYLRGIRDQVANSQPDLTKIKKLYKLLSTLDQRRGTDWTKVYPWLVDLFNKHIGN